MGNRRLGLVASSRTVPTWGDPRTLDPELRRQRGSACALNRRAAARRRGGTRAPAHWIGKAVGPGPWRLRTEMVGGGRGKGRAFLPARGRRTAPGSQSCHARWGAGTCRWEALRGEIRCPRDRALPGTSASWEAKEARWQMRDTNAHKPSKSTTVCCHLLSGCGLSGKRSSCALIGLCSLDVMDSTFDTTNQREEAVGSVRGLIRKWAGHCVESSQWAAGRPRELRREQLRVPPQALSASMERADGPR